MENIIVVSKYDNDMRVIACNFRSLKDASAYIDSQHKRAGERLLVTRTSPNRVSDYYGQ